MLFLVCMLWKYKYLLFVDVVFEIYKKNFVIFEVYIVGFIKVFIFIGNVILL